MSKVFPKDKRKRSRSSSNEANNSIVRGAAISRWFSGSGTSANGSASAEASEPREDPQDSPAQPPPSKRVCTPGPGKYSNYGLNDSFVKNVTQRVTGLLPATITKWFSSPSSANGSTPQAETDSSTEDEALEPPPQPPPTKRPCYPITLGKYSNHYGLNDVISIQEDNPEETTETTETSSYSTVQSPPGRTTFRRETNYVSTPLRTPDDSDRSERDNAGSTAQITVSQIGRSMEKKRKSLFGNSSSTTNDPSLEACVKTSLHTIKDREPCFKASLLGSPFYPGRTMYGGASSSLYLNQPNIRQRKTAVVQATSNADTSISSATRRVMDLLEHYSSPLIEAKRIPQYTRPSIDRSGRNTSIATYKSQELHGAAPAVSLLRLKQRHKLRDSMSGVRQIVASQSSTAPYPPPATATPEKDKFTSKVKTRVSATRPKRGESIDEMSAPLDLPSGGLVIDNTNLPKFSFSTPLPSQPTTSFAASKPQTVTSKITETSKPTAPTSDTFKFASPIRLSSAQPKNDQKTQEFTFGSPDREVDKKSDTVSSFVGAGKDNKSDDWKCTDCWVNNKAQAGKCVCCCAAKPSGVPAPRKCSICKLADSQNQKDKCVNCDKAAVNSISGTPKATDSKWKCEDCWVANEESAEKCVCCGGRNPKKIGAASAAASSTAAAAEWRCKHCWITNKNDAEKCAACGGLKPGVKKETTPATTNAFKMPTFSSSNTIKSSTTSEWRCGDCWVNNKNEIDKCVACGGARPGAKAERTATTIKVTKDTALQDLAKSQAAKWECPSCLVRNENNLLKCVCCEGAKPGTIKEADKKMFNFGITPNTTFKFGIEPAKQSETVNLAEKAPQVDANKKVESEKNNNSLANTPTFTFSAPKKSERENKNTSSTEKPKVQFTFGMPKQQFDTVDAAKPAFGKSLDVATTDSVGNDKQQVVSKLPTSLVSPKTTLSTFSSPLLTSNSFTTPLSTSPSLLTPSTKEEKKDAPTNPVLTPATKAESQPSFTFSAGTGIKLSSNLFSAPASTVVSTSSLSIPATASSLFTKPEAPATTTAAMFTLGTTTSAAAAPATAAPLFSFGSGTTACASPEVKATFNFSFGSNNKSETPMFKPLPAFGATDSAPTKFTLPATTSVVPAVTSASTLTTNNALPTSNIFGSNLPKENMFMTPTNSTSGANMFATPSTTANALKKSSTFTFGPSPFNSTATPAPAFGSNVSTNATATFGASASTNATHTFGASATSNATPAFSSNTSANATPTFGIPAQSNPPAFGAQTTPSIFGGSQPAAAPAPAFGAAAQSPFGLPSQNSNNQTSLFSSPGSTPSLFGGSTTTNPPANLFGSPAAAPAPAFGSGTPAFGAAAAAVPAFGSPAPSPAFGSPSVGASSGFGVPNAAVPSFKAPAPVAAPAFNFGAPQQPQPGVFGFGQQQQQQQQQQQAGIYSFGAAAGASPVQFNMGTGPGGPPNSTGRKIRKATRRSTTLR